MSSDEVINQIIRTIVQKSSRVLEEAGDISGIGAENHEANKTKIVESESGDNGNGFRKINEMFLEEIHSVVKQFHVTDTLAAFMIRAVVLNPDNGFNPEKEMSRAEVDRLIKACVDLITKTDDIEMETIRAQVYFDTNFPAQDEYLHKERLSRLEECSTLLGEIVDTRSKNVSVLEPLNRKIVSYVLLRSNVGIPTDIRVIREATAALESVFPVSELNSFLSLSRPDKELQLNGLTNLVTGIRLFNKHFEKGGDTIEPLPDYCNRELKELSDIVNTETKTTEEAIQYYKALLDYKNVTINAELTEDAADNVRAGLVFERQYLVYLDALREQVIEAEKHMVKFGMRYEEIITELKYVCKSKSAVPVDQVYPLFISLANQWTSLLDLLFLVAFRRGIADTLVKSAKTIIIPSTKILEVLSSSFKKDIEPEILTDSEVIKRATLGMTSLSMVNKHAEVVHPGNTTQYYKLPVEFGGYCAWSLAKRNGLVTPGDKNVGMVRYKDKLLSFSDFEKAIDFFKDPDSNMDEIVNLSKKHPCYVQLLHLYKFFPTVDTLEKARSYTRQRLIGQIPIVAEAGSQVDTHIVDHNIQLNYKWNEWDLRRDALMLVNLKKKLTHSTQTVQSHFRRDSQTQHYQQKDNITQTKKTGSTSVPRTTHFLHGLRNDTSRAKRNLYEATNLNRKTHFKIADLTIDTDGNPVPYGGGAFGLTGKAVGKPKAK